jgi:6-phosphogluconate dehydrogenase
VAGRIQFSLSLDLISSIFLYCPPWGLHKVRKRWEEAAQLSAALICLGVSLQALYASKIISYAQGFMLLRQAAAEFGWTLNYGGIALMWRGGCIIRR